MPTLDDVQAAFERALLALDRESARRILHTLTPPKTPLEAAEYLVGPTLQSIGVAWEEGQAALSQVYMSGRICEDLLESLLPGASPDRKSQPKIAVATLGDHHILGKRMVYASMRAAGYELLDYGQGVSPEQLVQRILADGIEVMLISVLLLPSALSIKKVRADLRAAGNACRLIVGGAVFLMDDLLWREVGADATGQHASDAPTLVRQVMGGMES